MLHLHISKLQILTILSFYKEKTITTHHMITFTKVVHIIPYIIFNSTFPPYKFQDMEKKKSHQPENILIREKCPVRKGEQK